MTTRAAPIARISIISPCYNERDVVGGFVASLLMQELPSGYELEVLIADGMSDDGTRGVLAACSKGHPSLRVIDNPGRIVSTGLNEAIRAATGTIIVRMDVHTTYAPDYVRRCVETLEKTGADNVGGPWRAAGEGYRQEAIALAFQSPFSSGGAGSHSLRCEGAVDSVYLGCWRKEVFSRVGMFDEELVRNQDDELNLRIVRAGGSVWQSPAIQSCYYPRDSLARLFSQYKQYGYWKVRVIQKHGMPASIRHLAPGGFVLALVILTVLAFGWTPAGWPLTLLLVVYAIGSLGASALTCVKAGKLRLLPIMPVVFAAYHFGYGYGFLRGVVDFVILRKGGSRAFSKITRGQKGAA